MSRSDEVKAAQAQAMKAMRGGGRKRADKIVDSLEGRWIARWQHWLNLTNNGDAFGIPVRQFTPFADRKFAFDFFWSNALEGRVAVEVQGATGKWSKRGRHSRHEGHDADAEKSRLAAAHGIRVLYFTTDDVKQERGFVELLAALRWKA